MCFQIPQVTGNSPQTPHLLARVLYVLIHTCGHLRSPRNNVLDGHEKQHTGPHVPPLAIELVITSGTTHNRVNAELELVRGTTTIDLPFRPADLSDEWGPH